jgi:glucosamine--fructose-6-phosphate aminotransferase (isomerizing)
VCAIGIVTQQPLWEKMVSNVREIKAREGTLIAVARESDTETPKVADHVIAVPDNLDELMPVLAIVPLQLLSYHIARRLGREIDQPRNLAKSVTVE